MKNRTPPRSQALRTGRHSQPGQIYLVTTTTHQRQPLFNDFEFGRAVVSCIAYLDRNDYVEQMAYVVMPDHLHWLFVLGERSDLSSVVKLLKGYSSRSRNAAPTCDSLVHGVFFCLTLLRHDFNALWERHSCREKLLAKK